MQRIEVNVLTGEQTIIELTTEEIAEAQAQNEIVEANRQQINSTPSLEQTVQDQQALIQSLISRLTALEQK